MVFAYAPCFSISKKVNKKIKIEPTGTHETFKSRLPIHQISDWQDDPRGWFR